MSRRNRGDNDGKYLRLTGLWPSKKNDRLFTGKIRNKDLGVLLDKLDEADKAHADVVVFLWENTEKDSPKDPEFTVQIAVSEDREGRGRDRSRGQERSKDPDDVEDTDNDEPEEDEPRRRSSKKEEPRKSRTSSKRDKNDW